VNKNTFGNSRAAEVLVLLVQDNKSYKWKVSRCFHDFSRGILAISDVKDVSFRKELYRIWFEKCRNRVLKSTLPETVKTFLINVEQTYLKEKNV